MKIRPRITIEGMNVRQEDFRYLKRVLELTAAGLEDIRARRPDELALPALTKAILGLERIAMSDRFPESTRNEAAETAGRVRRIAMLRRGLELDRSSNVHELSLPLLRGGSGRKSASAA